MVRLAQRRPGVLLALVAQKAAARRPQHGDGGERVVYDADHLARNEVLGGLGLRGLLAVAHHAEVVRASAHVREALGHRQARYKRDAPVLTVQKLTKGLSLCQLTGAADVLAAADEGRRQRGGRGEELTHGELGLAFAGGDHADRVAHAKDLVACL